MFINKTRYAKFILLCIILVFQVAFNINKYFLNSQNSDDSLAYISPKSSLDEWRYLRVITLSPVTPSDNYQVKLVFNNTNFDYSHAYYDGRDIRFLDQNQNQLNYWIENWDNSSNSIVWVRIPNLGTSQFTMYYGNPFVSSESNGEETFIFFDDFEGTSLNLSKWTTDSDQYSSITVSNSVVRLYSKPPSVFYERAILGFHDFYVLHGQTYGYKSITGGAIFTPTENNWLIGEMHWINSTSAPYYEDEIFNSDDNDNPSGPLPVRFFAHTAYYGPGTHYGSIISSVNETIGVPEMSMRVRVWLDKTGEVDIRLDWVSVRKWSESESKAIIGDENAEPSPPVIIINTPAENTTFLDSAPIFNLFIYEPSLDKTWYTLDDGITNITFVGATGMIDQSEWEKQNYGDVTIRFYVNNTWGYMSHAEVTVIKVRYEWNYLREIFINPSTPEDNYQIKIILNPSIFNYSRAQANGEDIRFMDVNYNPLPYWIETWNPSGISIIWVKILDFGTSNIYFSYGNEYATSESNGDNVFIFFDDFEGTSLNATKWNSVVHNYCGISVSDSVVRIYSDAPSTTMIASALGFHDTYVLEGQTYGTKSITGGATFSPSEDIWLTGEMHWINSTSAPYYENDVFYSDDTDNPSGPLSVRFLARTVYYGPGTHYGAWISSIDDTLGVQGRILRARLWLDLTGLTDIRIDWVSVRNEPETELITSLGEEIEITDPPIILISNPKPNEIFGYTSPFFKLFIYDLDLDSTWYSLDGGATNFTFTGTQGTIDELEWAKFENETVTIIFYANDSSGQQSQKILTLRKDILKPIISINNPYENEIFGKESPNFDIIVDEPHIDLMWYTLDNGITNITYDDFSGTIDQLEWNKKGNGSVIIRFYVLDKAGNEDFAEVTVIKEISDPVIIINNPIDSEVFGINAPPYNISVIEPDLDSMWYTLDDGLNNVTIFVFTGSISQNEWNKQDSGIIIIRFYANDTLGNIGYTEMVIEKDIAVPTVQVYTPMDNDIFGYNPPNYNVFITDSHLDSMWYSLDNGITHIPLLYFTGTIDQVEWDKKGSGMVPVRFYANDTLGNTDYIEVIIIKDLIDPLITIISPNENEIFGSIAPTFEISIIESNLNIMWYTLDNGITNIPFGSFTGSIDQTEWDKKDTGEVIIKFYVNDKAGNEGYAEITLTKDIDIPIITINSPKLNDFANSKAPSFNIAVQEPHIDLMWYTLDYGLNNFYFTEFTGIINQEEWDKFDDGLVIIRFYVRDKANNQGFTEVSITKDLIAPIITINKPEFGDVFVDVSPLYSIKIDEIYLDSFWYSLDDGHTNHSISEFMGAIDQNVWNSLSDGHITLRFYARDEAGNVGYSLVTITKRTTQEPSSPIILGYNLITLVVVILAATLILVKRKFKK